ncbi:TetR/AcrR family transcriptional regulator [[Mycobacterium] burgundiense]|jgi:AcrR family transcriptional regulator|uniref:TetR/AcrR family transcriptional regulator n=1 Tax=[Mycobacterium] burgundiense TaxID=3064286 RepID=A0ABN9N607_9MYCO|nr:TetR/AcrR family transcriptional regulator [Mycolicibacterium sp. MU0053]CAJ1501046.1 TetR/AcrR family transcriptional regulator [Mycolicibacterium sp. MU0053]
MSTSASGATGDDAVLLGDRRAPSKGERQRRAILDCLPELLATRPISELTIGEIAQAAGVRRSGFYFYFESKYAPLAVITSEIWTELMSRAQFFARGPDEPVRDFIGRTADIALGLWRDHEGVLTASVQAIPLDEQMAQLWDEWNQRLADVIAEQVLLDREQGVAQPVSGDVRGLITMLLEMTMHVFYMDRLRHNNAEQTRASREMVQAIWLAAGWGIPTMPPA